MSKQFVPSSTANQSREARVLATLSRAQKIADRLREGGVERLAAAQKALTPVAVTPSQAKVVAPNLSGGAAKALDSLNDGRRWLEAFASVREQIGLANARVGINGLLAQMDAHRRVVAVYSTVVGSTEANQTAAADIANGTIEVPLSSTSAYESLSLTPLSVEVSATLAKDLKDLQKEAFAMADRLAELNATKIELTLPADIAEQVGA